MFDTSILHPYYVKGYGESPEDPKVVRAAVVFAEGDDGKVHRGIALCSILDQFNRALGRKIAANRCEKAMQMQDSAYPINEDASVSAHLFMLHHGAVFGDDPCEFPHGLIYKAAYNVTPTKFEQNIIERLHTEKPA